ncbi:efflux transporter outer membrane subunit [Ideonella sp. DXS29W]|uniref:Efflux transporter outer membrane subunit n=1 Tax=Ideonella lacteola TaxID=2984193 RepID=A0ABU9BV79_9BURK
MLASQPIVRGARRAFTAAAIAALAACAHLEPGEVHPDVSLPDHYPAATAGDTASAERPWREQFRDPRLVQLIELALAQNRDLRVAALNIEQARALYRIQEAARWPGVSASAGSTLSRSPADLSPSGRASISRNYSATVGASAYELDLFGRVRLLNEQALAQFLATQEARRATQITVVSEVAQSWMGWAADLQRLQLAEQTLESHRQSVALTERRMAAGADSALTLRQQQSSHESARGEVARWRGQVEQRRQALAVLIGGPVPDEAVPDALDPAASLPMAPVSAGLPSELLLRRPDLLQSEQTLKAARANIGVARAAFYPRIALTASAGTTSNELAGLFKGGSGTWTFAPQLSLPVFDGGANQANLDSATAERDMALARYEKSIQVAFREVADALTARRTLLDRLDAQQALVQASRQALELAQARYQRGADSWLQVLDAQRTHDTARQGLVDLREQQADNLITLYKVLGGGVA